MGFNLWPTIGHKSRAGKVDAYPFDYDASERYCRPKTGLDKFPVPWNGDSFAQLGNMSPLLRTFDMFVWSQMYGPKPYGPMSSPMPLNLQMQITVPGMSKQLPQG